MYAKVKQLDTQTSEGSNDQKQINSKEQSKSDNETGKSVENAAVANDKLSEDKDEACQEDDKAKNDSYFTAIQTLGNNIVKFVYSLPVLYQVAYEKLDEFKSRAHTLFAQASHFVNDSLANVWQIPRIRLQEANITALLPYELLKKTYSYKIVGKDMIDKIKYKYDLWDVNNTHTHVISIINKILLLMQPTLLQEQDTYIETVVNKLQQLKVSMQQFHDDWSFERKLAFFRESDLRYMKLDSLDKIAQSNIEDWQHDVVLTYLYNPALVCVQSSVKDLHEYITDNICSYLQENRRKMQYSHYAIDEALVHEFHLVIMHRLQEMIPNSNHMCKYIIDALYDKKMFMITLINILVPEADMEVRIQHIEQLSRIFALAFLSEFYSLPNTPINTECNNLWNKVMQDMNSSHVKGEESKS